VTQLLNFPMKKITRHRWFHKWVLLGIHRYIILILCKLFENKKRKNTLQLFCESTVPLMLKLKKIPYRKTFIYEHRANNPTQISAKWIRYLMKKYNTSRLSWVYSKTIRLNFRRSVIIFHHISLLKEQKQYGYFNNHTNKRIWENTLDEIQNTYLWF
jgi:hypothetical protein